MEHEVTESEQKSISLFLIAKWQQFEQIKCNRSNSQKKKWIEEKETFFISFFLNRSIQITMLLLLFQIKAYARLLLSMVLIKIFEWQKMNSITLNMTNRLNDVRYEFFFFSLLLSKTFNENNNNNNNKWNISKYY